MEGKKVGVGELFYDHRTDIGEAPEDEGGIIQHIQGSIKNISEKLNLPASDTSAEVYTQIIQVAEQPVPTHQFFPAWQLEEDEALFVDMQAAVQASGKKEQRVWGFCTGGSGYAQKGVRLIGIGPGDEKLAHMVDEHVPFSQVKYVTAVLAKLMEEYTRNS